MEKLDISIETKKVYKIITPASFSILISIFFLYYIFVGQYSYTYLYLNTAVFILTALTAVIIHEVIHALAFIIFGRVPLKRIKFGIILKYLTPYAYCSQVIPISVYRLALILPTVILGVIPIILGFVYKNFLMFLIGDFMLIGGLGDMLIVWNTRKLRKGTRVLDHDKKVGCYIIVKKSDSDLYLRES